MTKDKMVEAVQGAILHAMDSACVDCARDYPEGCGCSLKAAQAALSAISQAGCAVVPTEATAAMSGAGFHAQYRECRDVSGVWKAMIAAGRLDTATPGTKEPT